MRLTRGTIRAAHLKQAGKADRRIREAFAGFLREQLRSVAGELRKQGVADVDAVFVPSEWQDALTDAMRPPMGHIMASGAMAELALLDAVEGESSKSTATDIIEDLAIAWPSGFPTALPTWLVGAVNRELDETFRAKFWLQIHQTTRGHIDSILREGVTEGWSIRRMAKAIEGPDYTRWRATAVARTESGRTLNAGHHIGIQGVQEATGMPIGKSWLSLHGSTSRPSHTALDGVTVPSDGMFTLGGVEIPYPAHRDLPAAEAINCQCSITSEPLFEALAE